MASRWLNNLNPEQADAVTTIHGPLLVLAGAGSGKTRVITHRIAEMIDNGIAPQNILAVTFTNKAANEMKHRLKSMVGRKASRVTMSTFHSLGLLMLKAEAKLAENARPFTVYGSSDQLSCLKEIVRRYQLERSLDLEAVLTRISGYKNDFILPKDLEITPSSDEYEAAAIELYPLYLEQMTAFSAYDFDDLVVKPTMMMEADENCRRRWAERFQYVLVDEYQDTNTAQMRLLKAIAGEHKNVCVVGDDDQAIYGWRGAKVQNILNFSDDFPGAKIIYLMRNYRSHGHILAVANKVIAVNKDRHPKAMIPVRDAGPKVRLVIQRDGDCECRWVAEHIDSLIVRDGYRPSDIAVLYRSNLTARPLELELRSLRVPYRIIGGTSFFDKKEVKDLLAYLKLITHYGEEISLRRVINYPARGIGAVTLNKLSAWAESEHKLLIEAVEKAPEILGDKDRALKPISDFLSLIKHFTDEFLHKNRKLDEVMEEYIKAIGLYEDIQTATAGGSGKAFEARWGNVLGFLESLQAYMREVNQPLLEEFINRVSLMDVEVGEEKESGERVTLSTLHGAKGLEFRHVILMGLEEGLLPHERTLSPHATDAIITDIAEERRLCYVGITRAKDELIMTRADKRLIRGKEQKRTPSRFLDPIPLELLDITDMNAPASADEVVNALGQFLATLE